MLCPPASKLLQIIVCNVSLGDLEESAYYVDEFTDIQLDFFGMQEFGLYNVESRRAYIDIQLGFWKMLEFQMSTQFLTCIFVLHGSERVKSASSIIVHEL
jgi:hypothetical protein